MNTASGHIGCDQRIGATIFKLRKNAGALSLRFSTVQYADGNARLQHLVGKFICAMLGANEEDGATLASSDLSCDNIFMLLFDDDGVVQHILTARLFILE